MPMPALNVADLAELATAFARVDAVTPELDAHMSSLEQDRDRHLREAAELLRALQCRGWED